MTAKLIAEEGLLKGTVLSIENDQPLIIGRDPDESQLVVEDPSASRKHVSCRLMSDGLHIQNLSTTNPIQVNDEEIKEPSVLHHGDSLHIGSTLFRFYVDTNVQVDDLDETESDSTDIAPDSEVINEEAPTPEPNAAQEEAAEKAPEAPVIVEEEKPRHSIFEDEEEHKISEDDNAEIAQVHFDLLDTSRWLLKVVSGPNNGAEFSLQPDNSYVIGTDPASCDIVFHDVSVSRQHARLSIASDETMTIEDLKSRNGTMLESKPVAEKTPLLPNTLVSVGTTTFLVYDREGDRHTIISPLLPAIVKVLQQEESRKVAAEKLLEQPVENANPSAGEEVVPAAQAPSVNISPSKPSTSMHSLIFLLVVTGLFVVAGMGTALLFKTQTVETAKVDSDKALAQALESFPEVNHSYNKTTGKLLLVGHVLTSVDRNQLYYNLQGLNFITGIDDNIVVDEFIWKETNQVLSKNPNWKEVSMHSPAPGKFVISGYLQTRKQAEAITSYLIQNFPYLDRLEKRVIVEEDVLSQINAFLLDQGMHDVIVKINNGEITLTGNVPNGQRTAFEQLLEQIRSIPGVRSIKNYVAELPPQALIVNISNSYKVTGTSHQGSGKIMVVINGRVLGVGDQLDGMTVTQITPNAVFLEKNSTNYEIDYNR